MAQKKPLRPNLATGVYDCPINGRFYEICAIRTLRWVPIPARAFDPIDLATEAYHAVNIWSTEVASFWSGWSRVRRRSSVRSGFWSWSWGGSRWCFLDDHFVTGRCAFYNRTTTACTTGFNDSTATA